jgi:hypothetical protein
MIIPPPRETVAMRACRISMWRYDPALQYAEALWRKERATQVPEGRA